MKTIGEVIEELTKFSKDDLCYAYEGEMHGIVIVDRGTKEQIGTVEGMEENND